MKIQILPSAREDLAAGFAFYEMQQDGLGTYFLESLFTTIDSLRTQAGIHRKIYGSYRLLAKTFPYAIYYSLEGSTAKVKAVLDCRRDPRWIRSRLLNLSAKRSMGE